MPQKPPGRFSTLCEFIDSLSDFAERPAFVAMKAAGTETLGYGELAQRVTALAHGLRRLGVAPGEVIALLGPTGPELLSAALAIIRVGAVAAPLDTQYGDRTLRHILADCKARRVFATRQKHGQLERVVRDESSIAKLRIILLDAAADEGGWADLMQAGREEALPEPLPEPGAEDIAVLFYTSGTTGPPKGVPLSHASLAYQLEILRNTELASATDRVLLPLPVHHVYPFVMGFLGAMVFGVPLVLPQSLTGPQVLRALREGKATIIVGVPRLYRAVYEGISKRFHSAGPIPGSLFSVMVRLCAFLRRAAGLRPGRWLLWPVHRRLAPQLRVLTCGGAALSPELAYRLEGMGWEIAMGYGLTETSPLLTLDLPGKTRIGSVGKPIAGTELRVDPGAVQGVVAPGAGEILARGPGVFKGYLNLPEKSAEAIDSEGWFHTGDLGRFDENGYLYVLGRVSTMIVTEGGENIQPEDLEEAYQESAMIKEIGILQREGGLAGLVVPDTRAVAEAGLDPEAAIRQAVAERSAGLPSYQRLADYRIVREPLQRTRMGKLRRHLLEERYQGALTPFEPVAAPGAMAVEEMSDEDQALLDNSAARRIWDWLPERFPGRRLIPDTSLRLDLNVDSLEWLSLSTEIGRQTGVELDDAAIARIDSVRDLLSEVADAAGTPTIGLDLDNPEQALEPELRRWLRPPGAVSRASLRSIYLLNRFFIHRYFRFHVDGAENIPPTDGVVLVPTHASYLDPFILGAALTYDRLRATYWAGWTGAAFSNALLRLGSRIGQVIPIDPERGVMSSLMLAAAVLKRRNNLVWFPEGGRSPDGRLQDFRPGLGVLLEHFPTPIVPVVIHGSYQALPTGRKFPRRVPVKVVFGAPLDPRELVQAGEDQAARIMTALHDRVAALQDATRVI